MIDREQLETRRAGVMADYQLVLGHLQEIDYWLEQLDREAESPPPAGPSEGSPGPREEE